MSFDNVSESSLKKRLRILHLEDNAGDAALIQTILEADGLTCEIQLVQKAAEFIAVLDKGNVDVILSDYTLPTFDGLTALKIAQTMRPEIPFIFVSGTIGEERATDAIRRGATDYVIKERLRHISAVIRRALREKEDHARMLETERKLRESEERFRALVEQSADGIALVNAQGVILYAGPSTERIVGYKKEEFEGKNGFDFVHPLDRERTMDILRNLTRHPGAIITTELRLKHKDGSWRWLEATGSNLLNNPTIQSIVINYRDVTERKTTDERLRKSQASLAAAQRMVHLGSWELDLSSLTDLNANPLRWSDEVYRIFGYQPGEFEPTNERFLAAVHPDDRERVESAVAKALQEGKEFKIEHRIVLPNGSERIVEQQSDVIFSSGKPLKMMGTVLDITERRRAEEKLRESEENFRSLFESARDAIFTIAPNAVITSLNKAFETITGWNRAEWLGKTFTDILHPDDRNEALEGFRRVLTGEVPPVREFRVRKKNGEHLVGEFTITPQVRNNNVVGLLGIARDVTERKKFEEEIRHAQKMESIGTLAGGIAHDFNNILGILLGYVSIFKSGRLEGLQLSETLQAMEKAVQRGAGLVKQILTFARKGEALMQPTNVNSVIEEIERMVQETFPRTVNFKTHLIPDAPMVEADATQLHQAILNLCINARDAMPKGGNLTISSERITGKQLRKRFADAAAQEYIQVSVSDDGIGMDEATKARIFEPFFTTKEIGKGTGLGLSVVFGVVRSHHGFVDVHSAPGRGTTFTLYFPVRTEKTEVIAETSKDENDVPGGNETILVVEDEEALQSLLKTFLEEKGYEVLTASNGLEAVERFQENKDRVALVFSDLGLPKLNGLDAFHRMKKIKPDIKTIFASGFIEPFEREEVRRMGVGEFLQKPYNPIQILRTVRNVLDSQ